MGQFKDPNDVSGAGPETPNVIQRNLETASDELNVRKAKREITDQQFHALMAQVARDYVAQAKNIDLNAQNALQWGEIYITAREWNKAEKALEFAVKADAPGRLKDHISLGKYDTEVLRLARVKAELGKVVEAITLTRSIFDVPAKAKVPILPAVLYEIAPPGIGKNHDFELAELLRDAIAQHEQAIIDPNTDAGRNFLLARPHHIQRAWELAAQLYLVSNHPEEAQKALDQARQVARSNVRL